MKLSVLTVILLAAGISIPSYASNVSTTSIQAQVQSDSLLSQTENELLRVGAGLRNFYASSLGWPTNLSQISNYYTGNFETPLGTIKGTIGTSSYQLSIGINDTDTNMVALVKSLASKLSGTYDDASNTLAIPVDTPQEAAIVSAMLSRLPDTSGSGLNTMQTDLSMGGFNINDIAEANATVINASTINTTDINATNITAVKADITTVNSNLIDTPLIQSTTGLIKLASNTEFTGTSTFNDVSIFNSGIVQASGQTAQLGAVTAESATVTGQLVAQSEFLANDAAYFKNGIYNGTGVVIADADGRLFYQGQDLETRYLGINDTAVDSDSLGGIAADNYAKKNVDNAFSAHQTFASLSTAGNADVGGALTAGTLTVSGNASVYNTYFGSRNIWASTVIDRVNSNQSRIGALESKVNSGSTSNAMGKWVLIYQTSSTTGFPNVSSYGGYAGVDVDAGASCLKGSVARMFRDGSSSNHSKFHAYVYQCR